MSVFKLQAFITGHSHGALTGEFASRREAEERFPKWSDDQIQSYLNGRDDGVNGDDWRLVRVREKLQSITCQGEQQ